MTLSFGTGGSVPHPTVALEPDGYSLRLVPGPACRLTSLWMSRAGMEALDEREVGYTRAAIGTEQIESLSWPRLPDGARVCMYVPVAPSEGGGAKRD